MKKRAITFQDKFNLALALTVVMMLATYFLGIKKTLALALRSTSSATNHRNSYAGEGDWDYLRKSQQRIDSVFSLTPVQDSISSGRLLEALGDGCKDFHLRIKEVAKSVLDTDSSYTVSTTRFVMEGTFKNLVLLVDTLERNKHLGKLASVNFKTSVNNRTQRVTVECILYLQNLSNRIN